MTTSDKNQICFGRRLLQSMAIAVLCVSLSGCLDPRFTRMPVWWPTNPVAENRSFQQADPFPDPNIGGETSVRPPGYTRPRTEPRRAAEQRMLRGLQFSPETIPPQYAPSASKYSKSVQ
ncbi:MAG: hypothetical protein AB8G99_01485 [Planctomycetaceae bacterium]